MPIIIHFFFFNLIHPYKLTYVDMMIIITVYLLLIINPTPSSFFFFTLSWSKKNVFCLLCEYFNCTCIFVFNVCVCVCVSVVVHFHYKSLFCCCLYVFKSINTEKISECIVVLLHFFRNIVHVKVHCSIKVLQIIKNIKKKNLICSNVIWNNVFIILGV